MNKLYTLLSGSNNRKHIPKMRWFLAAALAERLPVHGGRIDEDVGGPLPQRGRPQPQRLQTIDGRDVHRSLQALFEIAKTQLG